MNNGKYKSLGVNAVLNAFKSSLSIIFPLITYPYAFRILKADGIGRVNYVTSIVSYFALVASLGISTYAVREGAKVRNDEKAFKLFANQIFTINILTTIVAYLILSVCVVFIPPLHSYAKLIVLISVSIGLTTLGVEWINTIYEDYLFITIRSVVIQIISLGLLFFLVKSSEDYYVYALLTVISNGLICIVNWFYCKKYIHLKLVKNLNIRKHFKPIMILFANNIAISIYVNSDITMLGGMLGDYYVGVYEVAVKIYSVIKRILSSVYLVAVPRLAYYIGKKDYANAKFVYTKLVSNVTLLLLPVSTILFILSKEIIFIMGGQEYIVAVPTLQILSIGLIGAIFGGIVTFCLNIPLGRERINVIATILAAVINVLLNMVMIPLFSQNGAAITTMLSEFFVFVLCLIALKDVRLIVNVKQWGINFIHALVGCVSIVLTSLIIHQLEFGIVENIILVCVFSVIVYGIELILLKNRSALEVAKWISTKLLRI